MIKKYINDEIKLEKYQLIGIISLVVVISGLFGWIYEFIFYYFNFGMNKFYWQGGNFLPWINIYAIGSLMILLLTKKLKKTARQLAVLIRPFSFASLDHSSFAVSNTINCINILS